MSSDLDSPSSRDKLKGGGPGTEKYGKLSVLSVS
jgi:hypothetical protein